MYSGMNLSSAFTFRAEDSLLYHEDRGGAFLRSAAKYAPDYTASFFVFRKHYPSNIKFSRCCQSTLVYRHFQQFDVFSTVHHSIELFHQPNLMHNFLYSLTIRLLHYYPRHVSSINMPVFRRTNCIHTASSIFALCKRLHSTLVESGLQH